MVNKNLYVNSLNGKLLYIADKMFGVFNLEQEMSVGGTIFYLVNLDVILPDSYRGIPLYLS
jgi:hypothetical protein